MEIIGETQLQKRLVDSAGRIDKATRRALSQTGTEVKRRMRSLVPIKDGDWRNAITMKSRGTRWSRTVIVGPETSRITPEPGDNRGARARVYPAFHEFGTARLAANPVVQKSLDGAAERLTARLNAIVRDI